MAKRNRNDDEGFQKKGAAGKIADLLSVPKAAVSSVSQIELIDNTEAVIDGAQGVLEYGDGIVRVSLGKKIVKFTGRSLNLKSMDSNSLIIEGYITSVEFM
jgi:sporulation protein YqfC